MFWGYRIDTKVTDQDGLLAYLILLTFVFSWAIRRFFSLESLLFLALLGANLINIYYAWGCFMIMTGVRYFQNNHVGKSTLETDKEKYDDN